MEVSGGSQSFNAVSRMKPRRYEAYLTSCGAVPPI